MLITRLAPARHFIPPQPVGEFGRWLEREFPRRLFPQYDFFVYFHRRAGNWVLASWLNRERGEFRELLILGREPTATADQAELIRFNIHRPTSFRDVLRAVASDLRDSERRDDEERAAFHETQDQWVRDHRH